MIRLIFIIFGIFSFSAAHANDPCSSNEKYDTGTTFVYFTNGIHTQKKGAKDNLKKVISSFHGQITTAFPNERFRYRVAYNPTEKSEDGSFFDGAGDINELYYQQSISRKYPNLTALQLAHLVETSLNDLRLLLQYFDDGVVPEFSESQYTEALQNFGDSEEIRDRLTNDLVNSYARYTEISNVVNRWADEYICVLRRGARVIVFAHSQGNLFANQSVQVARNSLGDSSAINSIGVVSVATPAEKTANNGVKQYVTAKDDRVIDAARLQGSQVSEEFIRVLPGNIDNDLLFRDDRSGTNHNFITDYMSSELPSFKDDNDDTYDISQQFHNLLRGLPHPSQSTSSLDRVFISQYEPRPDRDSFAPSLSGDAQIIAFTSQENNHENSNFGGTEIYIYDRAVDEIEMVTGVNSPRSHQLSGDGNYLAYADAGRGVFRYNRTSGERLRVDLSSTGGLPGLAGGGPQISGGGRYIAFNSESGDLVENDNNNRIDVFMRDVENASTYAISDVNADERYIVATDISADGRYVAMHSDSKIYVYDQIEKVTDIIGTEYTEPRYASISDDGRLIVFQMFAGGITCMNREVLGACFATQGIILHNRETNTSREITVDELGTRANSTSFSPRISPDGRYIAFVSAATNWIENDNNNVEDVFLHDLQEKSTIRLSENVLGEGADQSSIYTLTQGLYQFGLDVSSDAIEVAFVSHATNLVPEDINQHSDIFIRYIAPSDSF